jgi:hypothetical protein
MRRRFITLSLALLCAAAMPAMARTTFQIGIQVNAFPLLVPIPGHPVYYAPRLQANYFFHDGLYWVLEGDDWFVSAWYNGPWEMVVPLYVPYALLRVPVLYYRAPPPHFHAWPPQAPPRWEERWSAQWSRQNRDWDRPDPRAVPRPAPLPRYQEQYSGKRYPTPARQAELQRRNYRYEPRSDIARLHYEQQRIRRPAPSERGQERGQGHDQGRGR